jgi:GWxTD domain-containing protein
MPLKRTASLLLLLLLFAGIAGAASDPASPSRARERAEALYQRSLGWLLRNTVETRRQAVGALEEATLLDPGNGTYELALARAYYASGFLKSARQRFERVAQIQPGDAAGQQGLGLIWRRDWLKYLDPRSLARSVELLKAATRLDPGNTDAWLALAPLLVEQSDEPGALRAAFSALRSDPGRSEAHLAVAHALYRSGLVHEADSVFRVNIPRLARKMRDRYDDISPVATEQDTAILNHLPPAERVAFIERFWQDNDPDLTTPENEARLEYWARVTQAYFLFFDAKRGGWDERGEVFVRYGPPAEMQYNAVGGRLSRAFASGPDFPANVLVWNYPDLGMRVTLEDRLLSEFYLLPVSLYSDPDPRPDPDSLARCADALGTRGGRGVFHLLPPGAKPLPLESIVARFEGSAGPRVLAQFEVPGGPADSVWADWSVLDSARVVRARASLLLGPSACAAATRRVGEFAADLEPGPYVVSVTVPQAGRARGRELEPRPERRGHQLRYPGRRHRSGADRTQPGGAGPGGRAAHGLFRDLPPAARERRIRAFRVRLHRAVHHAGHPALDDEVLLAGGAAPGIGLARGAAPRRVAAAVHLRSRGFTRARTLPARDHAARPGRRDLGREEAGVRQDAIGGTGPAVGRVPRLPAGPRPAAMIVFISS